MISTLSSSLSLHAGAGRQLQVGGCAQHAGRRPSAGGELVPKLPQFAVDLGVLASSTLTQFIFRQQPKLQLNNLRLVVKQRDQHVERKVTTSSSRTQSAMPSFYVIVSPHLQPRQSRYYFNVTIICSSVDEVCYLQLPALLTE